MWNEGGSLKVGYTLSMLVDQWKKPRGRGETTVQEEGQRSRRPGEELGHPSLPGSATLSIYKVWERNGKLASHSFSFNPLNHLIKLTLSFPLYKEEWKCFINAVVCRGLRAGPKQWPGGRTWDLSRHTRCPALVLLLSGQQGTGVSLCLCAVAPSCTQRCGHTSPTQWHPRRQHLEQVQEPFLGE